MAYGELNGLVHDCSISSCVLVFLFGIGNDCILARYFQKR